MRESKIIITILTVLMLISIAPINQISANTEIFTVHRLTYDSKNKAVAVGGTLLQTSSFEEAKKRMDAEAKIKPDVVIKSNKSKSPMQFVAADRGMVQSYPYRNATVHEASKTLKIYRSKDMAGGNTYVEAHFKLYLEDSLIGKKGLVHKVSFQGIDGWHVENNAVDIIPYIYIANSAPITLGGNEDYYENPEAPQVISPGFDRYVVSSNFELSVEYQQTFRGNYSTVGPYAKVPTWLKPGKYFSKDGIHFYNDFEFKDPVKDQNGRIGEFYPYYVWLPLRSRSNYTGVELKKHNSKNSVYYNKENLFVEYGEKYGINPLLNYAQATHESGYGTSSIAKNKNNLYGWNAHDSNPGDASYYATVEQSIREHSGINLRNYLTPEFSFHYGTSSGNKSSGITLKYASDPFYGEKVATYAYSIDKANGFKDYNAYNLHKTKDGTNINYFKDSSGKTKMYTTESVLVNQIVSGYETTNNHLKVNSHVPFSVIKTPGKNDFDKSASYHYSDANTELLYIPSQYASRLQKAGNNGKISTKRVVIEDKLYDFTVKTDGLNLRQTWTQSSDSLVSLKKGTHLVGSPGDNGWTKVYYKDLVGYVSSDHLIKGKEQVDPPITEEPDIDYEVPSKDKFSKYVVDSKEYPDLRVRKGPSVKSDAIGSLDNKSEITAAKYDNEWHIIEYAGSYGFVASKYIVKKQDIPQHSTVRGDANGDKKVSIADLMLMKNHMLGKIKIDDKYIENVKLTNKDRITITDLMRVKGYLQGKNGLD